MTDKEENSCDPHLSEDQKYEPIKPLKASGKAPVLVEIICERVHCVLYDFAINTVDMIAEKFEGLIDIRTVIRQGDEKDARYFLTLCEKAGKMLTVPTILLDGEVVRSCSLPVSYGVGKQITTIEGTTDNLNYLREAWEEVNVPQCGYCQSGQLIAATSLLNTNPNPSDQDIDDAMCGNIWRCGNYPRIRKAIHKAVKLKNK